MTSRARLLATVLLLAPAVSATARPPATAAPKAPVTTPATPPAAPAGAAAQRPKGKIALPAVLGAVTFDHENHAGKPGIACTTCHHPSCHKQKGGSAPVKCLECHKKK